MYDFTLMILTVPMWGSEGANSKTEIHITNTARIYDTKYEPRAARR